MRPRTLALLPLFDLTPTDSPVSLSALLHSSVSLNVSVDEAYRGLVSPRRTQRRRAREGIAAWRRTQARGPTKVPS